MAKSKHLSVYLDPKSEKMLNELTEAKSGKLRFLKSKNMVVLEAIREMHKRYIKS